MPALISQPPCTTLTPLKFPFLPGPPQAIGAAAPPKSAVANGFLSSDVRLAQASEPLQSIPLQEAQPLPPAQTQAPTPRNPEQISPQTTLPEPNAAPPSDSSPFTGGLHRLPVMSLPPDLGTPQPTPETQKRFDQFVQQEVAPENTLKVVVGRAKVLVLHEAPRRVYIPREEVAEYQVITPTQIAVVGKKVGTAVLSLWFPDPAQPNDPSKDHLLTYLVLVVSDPQGPLLERQRLESEVKAFEAALKILEQEIKKAFPDSSVMLGMVGEQVVVRGEAKDVVEAAQILRIVSDHTPNRSQRRVQPQDVRVQFIPGLGDETAAVNAIRSLLLGNPSLVNLLHVPGEQQVMLMVTVAEVNRTAARSIGMDFSITKGKFAFAQVSGNLFNTTGATAAGTTASGVAGLGGNLPTSIDNGSLLLAINALRTQNFARTLAEPNLTTINGKSASFHAGGSFPVPQTNVFTGGAASEVVYIPFGVQLQFVPYVTDRDRVRLEIQAAVSTRSATTTAVAGSDVPSELDDRTFQTTVDLREGQTLAVAGLISTNFGGTSNRVPFFGDLPLIGRLGGFDQLSSGEQELVVLVTPVLVHPLERCQTPNLPGSDVFEPGDVEFYLGGHLEGLRSEDFRAGVAPISLAKKHFATVKMSTSSAPRDRHSHAVAGPAPVPLRIMPRRKRSRCRQENSNSSSEHKIRNWSYGKI